MTDLATISAASGLPPDVTGTIITVGTFDGVHLGHRDVVDRLVARARERGLKSLLVTFDPHPLEVVNPAAAPPMLTTPEEKAEVLVESGVDYMALMPFTRQLADYSAEQFVELVLRRRFRLRGLMIGYDHGFGRQRGGDAALLRTLGERVGFTVEVVEAVAVGDHAVSSTSIRRAVAGGDLPRAAAGLGRLYSVNGTVIPGVQRGGRLGFPTINVALPPARKLLPPEGVYVVRVQTRFGSFGGMLNLGGRPTFGESQVSMEAHLFEASGDFYGARVRVEFIRRLRDVHRFASADALVAQLRQDEADARSALTLFARDNSLKGYP